MNPLLFGTSTRRLFGVHSPATGRLRRAAVICPPLDQEYVLTHRACRLLAERLAAAGTDALRFDYYGTGDSAGEPDAVDFDGCVADARTAVDEIQAIAGVRSVTLVGLRAGAGIALLAATHARTADRLVLWDPIPEMDLHGATGTRANLLVVTEDLPAHRRLHQALGGEERVDFALLPNPPVWTERRDLGLGAVPVSVLEHIGQWRN